MKKRVYESKKVILEHPQMIKPLYFIYKGKFKESMRIILPKRVTHDTCNRYI